MDDTQLRESIERWQGSRELPRKRGTQTKDAPVGVPPSGGSVPAASAAGPLSLLSAIPDHPWVDAADGVAVRIATTVGAQGPKPGTLQTVVAERSGHGEGYDVELSTNVGTTHADLTTGTDVSTAVPLAATADMSNPGVKLHGSGFIVTPEEAGQLGAHRQRQQGLHPDLTLTDMYNVLEKLRAAEQGDAGKSPAGVSGVAWAENDE